MGISRQCAWRWTRRFDAERFNRTLATERAYRQPFASNDARTDALGPWLATYNSERAHHALNGQTPAQPTAVNNLTAEYT